MITRYTENPDQTLPDERVSCIMLKERKEILYKIIFDFAYEDEIFPVFNDLFSFWDNIRTIPRAPEHWYLLADEVINGYHDKIFDNEDHYFWHLSDEARM